MRFARNEAPDYLVVVPTCEPILITRIDGVNRIFEIEVFQNTVVTGDLFVANRPYWTADP